MGLSPAQILVISGHVTTLNKRANALAKGMDFGLKRLKKLSEYKLYIEQVIINAQMAEHNAKLIAEGYLCESRIFKTLGEHDPYTDIKFQQLDDDTLGELIGKLKLLGAGKSFLRALGRINNLRKEMIHHLFDGNRDEEKADRDAKRYLEEELPELILEIKKATIKVEEEVNALAKASSKPKN